MKIKLALAALLLGSSIAVFADGLCLVAQKSQLVGAGCKEGVLHDMYCDDGHMQDGTCSGYGANIACHLDLTTGYLPYLTPFPAHVRCNADGSSCKPDGTESHATTYVEASNYGEGCTIKQAPPANPAN